MKHRNRLAWSFGLLALVVTAAVPARAADQKEDLELFRTELTNLWKPLADTTQLLLGFASGTGMPTAQLEGILPIASLDPITIEQSIATLSTEQLRELKRQYDAVRGWQNMGGMLENAIPDSVRTGLTSFASGDRPFPETNDFAQALCGLVEGIGIADTLQTKQTFSAVALGIYETLEAIAIPFDVACDASPCSVALFDLPIVGPLKVALCGAATVSRIAATVARAVVDSSRDCNVWTFYNGVEQRVDARLSTLAPLDSVGQRSGGEFAGENLHAKLEDRLDVTTTSRSTQDSIDGQRGGRPPSPEKSLRTVVDHTDQVRLPELERTIDETLELAKKQGELMRDFRDLLIRMKIESDLIDSSRNFREALLQLPSTIPGHKRAFCERDIVLPCLAPGPDREMGTADDVADASLCPNDAQPAESCDLEHGVCSRTRATACVEDADCPSGETCDGTSHPCVTTRERECSFDEDCPTGRARQGCVEADRQRGYFELVRQIVGEAINMTAAAGEQTHDAKDYLASADALVAAGNFRDAYTKLRLSYQATARVKNGH